MVEDVVGIDARHPHIDTSEGQSLETVAIDAAQLHVAYLIVAARMAAEDIDAHLRGVDAEIELLEQSARAEAEVLDVERIAEEEPAPAEERAHLGMSVGSQRDALIVASQHEILEGSRTLQHHGELIVLGLDIVVLRTVEFTDGLTNETYLLVPEAIGRQHVGALMLLCTDDRSHSQHQHYRQQSHQQPQNLLKMRSIAQLTGVADTLVQVQIPSPCRCSMTALMSGYCTYGGLGTLMRSSP